MELRRRTFAVLRIVGRPAIPRDVPPIPIVGVATEPWTLEEANVQEARRAKFVVDLEI